MGGREFEIGEEEGGGVRKNGRVCVEGESERFVSVFFM